jgi:hypothetical protein
VSEILINRNSLLGHSDFLEGDANMILLQIFTNEIRPDCELVDRLAVVFEVHGQKLTLIEGDARFIQRGIPVYSERYDRLIDFDADGEEWARNLPTAYRNATHNLRRNARPKARSEAQPLSLLDLAPKTWRENAPPPTCRCQRWVTTRGPGYLDDGASGRSSSPPAHPRRSAHPRHPRAARPDPATAG